MKHTTYDATQYVHISTNPSWINSENTAKYWQENLANIFLFYVVFCPCKQYAIQGRTLDFYGWKKNPWSSKRYLKGTLDHTASTPFIKQRAMTEWYNVKRKLIELRKEGQQWYKSHSEFAVYSNAETNDYMSLFYHIRCAFAHGRFGIFEHSGLKWYAFENGVTKGKRFFVKARIVLKEATLLGWMKIITSGPQVSTKKDSFAVITAMNNTPSITQQQLSNELRITENDLRSIIRELKETVDLQYVRNEFGKPGIWQYNELKYQQLLSA